MACKISYERSALEGQGDIQELDSCIEEYYLSLIVYSLIFLSHFMTCNAQNGQDYVSLRDISSVTFMLEKIIKIFAKN